MMKRIFFDLLLLGAIFYTPWWVATPLAFLGAFLFNPYYEIFAFGAVIDLLYGTPTSALRGTVGVVGSVGLFLIGILAAGVVRSGRMLRR